MTFTEAAAEILRLVGRPLHYKKITELAIERNLLSHVGKAPELTMSSRLATIVKKDKSESEIIKVKPGVFALRSFGKEALALADEADEVDVSKLPPPEASPPPPPPRPEGEEAPPPRRLPGADVFPAEEDDDRPILADLDAPKPGASTDKTEAASAAEGEEGRKGRRRRRRRGRRDDDMSETTDQSAEGGAGNGEAEAAGEAPVEGQRREAREPQQGRRDRHRERDRGDRDRGDRDRGDRDRGDRGDRDRNDRDRNDRDRGDRDRDRGDRRPPPPSGRLPEADLNREPEDGDLLGKELADACFHVLAQSSDANPLSYTELARLLVARGRLSGEPASLAPTVAAAIRAETARGESGRVGRPRFRHVGGGVALTGWYFPREVVHRERDALRAIERYAHELRRSFLRKLGDLPAGGFAELFATWLNSQGVGSLRGVRRPTSSGTEMHFAGVRRRGPEEVRIGIVVLRGSRDQGPAREVGRERVVEMRGTAHHYGGATELWIVTTGQVQSGAHEEASQPASVPVALFDGSALAESMEQARIGLVPVAITVPSIDLDLFDALRGSVEPPARDREPPMREPRGEGRSEGRREERPEAPKAEGEETAARPESPEGEAAGAPAEDRGEGEGGRRRRRRRRRGGGGEGQPTGTAGSEASEDEDESESEATDAASSTAVETPAPPSDAEDDVEGAAADAEDDE